MARCVWANGMDMKVHDLLLVQYEQAAKFTCGVEHEINKL